VEQPILKLKPAIKNYLWGGTRLREEYGKQSDSDIIAESWELSTHPDGLSIIENGEYAGITLAEYLTKHPEAMGTNCRSVKYMPIVKLIDAKENLSIQVHPDGENGKSEAWYVLECTDGAELICGFKNEITVSEFRAAIENNTLSEKLNHIPVKKGDVFFIEAGTVHAIGKGILIAEVQQNSNSTYRVYDYGRVDANGNQRELHIDKAVKAAKLIRHKGKSTSVTNNIFDGSTIIGCEHFVTYKLRPNHRKEYLLTDETFLHMLILDGTGTLEYRFGEIGLKKGDSIFIPAGSYSYKISGDCIVLFTEIRNQ